MFLSVLFGALAFAGPVTPEDVARHKQRMDQAQDLKDGIHDALEAKDAAKAAADAEKLIRIGQREQQYWTKAELPDARQLAKDNLSASRDLASAARARKWDLATKALERVETSCRTCHDLHPEKRVNTMPGPPAPGKKDN